MQRTGNGLEHAVEQQVVDAEPLRDAGAPADVGFEHVNGASGEHLLEIVEVVAVFTRTWPGSGQDGFPNGSDAAIGRCRKSMHSITGLSIASTTPNT